MSLRKRLSAIVSSPLVQLALGVAMMACGVAELVGEIGEGLAGEGGPRGAHGVVLFGLLHGVKSVLDLIEGFERVEEAPDRAHLTL